MAIEEKYKTFFSKLTEEQKQGWDLHRICNKLYRVKSEKIIWRDISYEWQKPYIEELCEIIDLRVTFKEAPNNLLSMTVDGLEK